ADLDDISSPLHLIAHSLAALVRAVAHTFNRSIRFDTLGWKRRLVAMSTGRPDRMYRSENAWTFRNVRVDSIAQTNVEKIFCAHIAHSCKSSLESALGV